MTDIRTSASSHRVELTRRTPTRRSAAGPAGLNGRGLLMVLAVLGACTGLQRPDDMFPDPDDTAGVERAIAVCRPCPVPDYCAEQARQANARHGVWAGRLLDGEAFDDAGAAALVAP